MGFGIWLTFHGTSGTVIYMIIMMDVFFFFANYIYDNNDGGYLAWLDTEDKFDRNMACLILSGNQTTRL